MNKKTRIYELPVASTDFTVEAYMCANTIHYTYLRDGVEVKAGLHFKGVASVRYRAEPCCTAWHIEDAYDTLVEVSGSSWIEEVDSAIPEHLKGEMHHFMIYLDSAGAFEIIAESWELVPDIPAGQEQM